MHTKLENPYLEEARRDAFLEGDEETTRSILDLFNKRIVRGALVKKYAWAIPSDKAIFAIAQHSPIVDVGAGKGYWAHLLDQAGASVHAFDVAHRQKAHGKNGTWFPVEIVKEEDIIVPEESTLMLCWPPRGTPMAFDHLSRYAGNTVVYVGEPKDGITADKTFHHLLDKEWICIEIIDIPSYWGLRDFVAIFHRKEKTCDA